MNEKKAFRNDILMDYNLWNKSSLIWIESNKTKSKW